MMSSVHFISSQSVLQIFNSCAHVPVSVSDDCPIICRCIFSERVAESPPASPFFSPGSAGPSPALTAVPAPPTPAATYHPDLVPSTPVQAAAPPNPTAPATAPASVAYARGARRKMRQGSAGSDGYVGCSWIACCVVSLTCITVLLVCFLSHVMEGDVTCSMAMHEYLVMPVLCI